MATVGQITAAYENFLVPVLEPGPGVCLVCGTSVSGTFPMCWQCGRTRDILRHRADAVLPIALAVKGGQLAYELSTYKNSPNEETRRQMRVGLAAVTWRMLADHEACLAQAVGAADFPIVTTVASTSGRADDPLGTIVGTLVGATRDRYEALLAPSAEVPQGRDPHPERYLARRQLAGEDVLLIDDTWTTGSHAQSAASALKEAGAGRVGLLVIGRHFTATQQDPYRDAAEAYLKAARAHPWDWSTCRLHVG
ncbi:hypothetical protein acdb102_22350 [Acidothermaceae bacterium B102]|nr:hypothetical protein acdb102_22350 [Acidothermaceae bacterium B102]